MSIERLKHLRTKWRSELRSKQTCFAADRGALVRHLKAVGDAIEYGATEMTMIAAESVFDEPVSKVLAGEARAMYRMVRELKHLRLEVRRARLPETRK
ncbi:MAG: hypothetical protein ACREQH_00255 [Candidatus Binatus sp.]